MNADVVFLFSLSILLPLIVGIIRLKYILNCWWPIMLLLVLGLVNEIISYKSTNSAVPSNIFSLLEGILFIWQFRLIGNIFKNRRWYAIIISVLAAVWFLENIVFLQISHFGMVYFISYSFVLILIGVNQLNWLIINDRSNILKNPIFLLCIGVIIFYSYTILTEIFYYYASGLEMKHKVFYIESYVNIFSNVLLALALLCIPRKKVFILQ